MSRRGAKSTSRNDSQTVSALIGLRQQAEKEFDSVFNHLAKVRQESIVERMTSLKESGVHPKAKIPEVRELE